MNEDLIGKLIYNAALLLSLSLLTNLGSVLFRKNGILAKITYGLIIGLIGIAIMLVPITYAQGIIFDGRSILLSVTAIAFGAIPTLIAGAMITGFRYYLGGIGTYAGMLMIVCVSLFGLMWRKYVMKEAKHRSGPYLYLYGLYVHIIMLACLYALPFTLAVTTLRNVSLEIMLIYPVGTLILAALILFQIHQQELMISNREADFQYRDLFENNHVVIMFINMHTGKIVDVNPAAEKFYGWDKKTLTSMNISQINALSDEEIKNAVNNPSSSNRNYFEFKHRRADGRLVDVEVYSGRIHQSGNRLLYSIVHDISSRKTAQLELEDSEKRFRTLVENAPYAIFIKIDQKFAFLNKTACAMFGIRKFRELIGKPVLDRIHPAYHSLPQNDIVAELDEKIPMPPREEVYLNMEGTSIHVSALEVPIQYEGREGTLVFALDNTKIKALEQMKTEWEIQMRQQQKLEAIGTLAGGVAHEINNPLNGILNYAQLILDEIGEASESSVYAKEIITETDRISEIVRNLLQFSRMEKQTYSFANLKDIVTKTSSLIQTIIKKDDILLEISLQDDLPDFKCRSQQIQQVLMNLLTNARDALNQRYVGYDPMKKIELKCILKNINDEYCFLLSVKDYGCGIQDDIKGRIFEPFFSTKPKDKGTGLGLSISYGIIKDHKGEILVESIQDEYTEFTVKLPVENGLGMQGGVYE